MVEQEEERNAFGCANDVVRANRLYQQLLFRLGNPSTKKKKESIEHPNIPSVIHPVPYGEDLPVPDAPTLLSFESDEESGEEETEKDDNAGLQSDPNFDEAHFSRPHLITQGELHNLVRSATTQE